MASNSPATSPSGGTLQAPIKMNAKFSREDRAKMPAKNTTEKNKGKQQPKKRKTEVNLGH